MVSFEYPRKFAIDRLNLRFEWDFLFLLAFYMWIFSEWFNCDYVSKALKLRSLKSIDFYLQA